MHFQKRKITDSMRKMIRKRTNTGFRSPWLIFGLSMALPAPTIIFFQFRTIPILQDSATIVGYCLLGYLALFALIILFQIRSKRRIRKLYELVLTNGNYEQIEVIEKSFNLSYRMNKVPQQIIRVKYRQEIIELKTFDLTYSNLFNQSPLKVLVHPQAPGIFIPENSWEAYNPKKKKVDSSFSV